MLEKKIVRIYYQPKIVQILVILQIVLIINFKIDEQINK